MTSFIFGAGGHARVIASFLTGNVELIDTEREEQAIAALQAGTKATVYIGVGNNRARRQLFDRLVKIGCVPGICVAPTAFVARDATLMPGAVVCAGAVVGSRAQVGSNTIINTLSSLDHDCQLGDHSQITAGVTIGGGVTIGRDCFFGIKSAVIPGIKICDRVSVMAGSVVVKDIMEPSVLGGVPARMIKSA